MTSQQTKQKYIQEFESTEIKIKNQIEDSITFNLTFVNQPFFEIKGNSDKKYRVSFYDTNSNLVYQSELTTGMYSQLNRSYFEDWKILVESDGYSQLISYDPSGKRVYISIDSSSLGDNIAWMPYIEEFRKKWNCHVVTSTFWNFLFEKSYPEIEFVTPGTAVHNLYAMYTIGWFWDGNKEPEEPNLIPLQKAATNILGLEWKEIKPQIDFQPKEKPYTGKYVTIAPHSTSGLKYWNNATGWQDTINYLRSIGYKVINVSKDDVDYKGVINMSDKSIENTMNVIHHSEFLIGLSSGLSWLSWAIGKHVVMISNFTTSDHEFQSNCTRIVDYSVCFGCWNKKEYRFDKGDWNWCPVYKGTDKQFECHKKITSEMVINRIKSMTKLENFEWGWMKDNLNQKEILIKEIFEDKIYEKVFEIEQGDIVMDIGSSVGPFVYSASEKIKHAYCLEPSDVEFDTLLQNMKDIPSTCLKMGISSNTGVTTGDYIYGGQSEMDCISFMDLVNKYNIDKIDFLKTDCEGGEYDIFTKENLDWIKNNVRKISGEWHLGPNLKDKFLKFRDEVLVNFSNYKVYSIDGYDITENLFTDWFTNYFTEVIIHIKNFDDTNISTVSKLGTTFKVWKTNLTSDFWKNRYQLWEDDTFNFIQEHLDENKNFIDIGAWIGPMTLFASCQSKNCISFEPDPIAHNELRKNILINNIDNVLLSKEAVSIHDEVEMSASELGQSMTRIGPGQNSFSVDCINMSKILEKYELSQENISMIKIDVEGHEVELLTDETLLNLNVPMWISFHPGFFNNKEIFFEKVKSFLIHKGYDISKYPHGEEFFDIGFEKK